MNSLAVKADCKNSLYRIKDVRSCLKKLRGGVNDKIIGVKNKYTKQT